MRFPLRWTWFYLPVPMLGLFLFTLGASFFFATINVFYRDVSHIVQILLSAWFYFLPIIYSLDFVPAKYHWIFRLNPLLYVLNGFRCHSTLPYSVGRCGPEAPTFNVLARCIAHFLGRQRAVPIHGNPPPDNFVSSLAPTGLSYP
jgi:ABC-type polysaccharide/polyol phosphate export permease